MRQSQAIVVGGGLAGIFGSIILAEKFDTVYLIEREPECGGLLKSVLDKNGVPYDMGTHIPDTTDIPEIDKILFGSEKQIKNDWTKLGNAKTGNFFAGKWNLETARVDARSLPTEVYEKGTMELLSLNQLSDKKDIVSYLYETIGATFTHEIIKPVIKKLYNVEINELIKNSSVNYFGLNQIMLLSREVSNKLKEIPVFDEKISYHTRSDYEARIRRDGVSSPSFYYPKSNLGAQFWINRLMNIARDKNVKIINNDYVDKIQHSSKQIRAVQLGNSGKTLNTNFLLWTVPPTLALKASDVPAPSFNLKFRTANIFHFNYDSKLLNTESTYLWNWDAKYKSFRITLYPNMQPHVHIPLNRVTIEALSDKEDASRLTLAGMDKELRKMGIVDTSSKIISNIKQIEHNTFPVPNKEFQKSLNSNYEILTDSFNNILVAGRFSGKNWFHRDVLKEIFFELEERFG